MKYSSLFFLPILLSLLFLLHSVRPEGDIYVDLWNRLTEKKCNKLCEDKLIGIICGQQTANCCVGKDKCTADGLGWSCDGFKYKLKCGTSKEWFNN